MISKRVELILYLLDLFTDTITNFGKDDKSVSFYKKQLERLFELNQVTLTDINIIYKLLGIRNTDIVKWEKTETKLYNFVESIKIIKNLISDEEQIKQINNLYNSNMISLQLKTILLEIFELEEKRTPSKPMITPNTNVKAAPKLSASYMRNMIPTGSYTLNELLNISKQHNLDLEIQMENPNAVCSRDTRIYHLSITQLLNDKKYFREDCFLGVYLKVDNPDYTGCSGSRMYNYIKQEGVTIKSSEYKKLVTPPPTPPIPQQKTPPPNVNTSNRLINDCGNYVRSRSC